MLSRPCGGHGKFIPFRTQISSANFCGSDKNSTHRFFSAGAAIVRQAHNRQMSGRIVFGAKGLRAATALRVPTQNVRLHPFALRSLVTTATTASTTNPSATVR